MNEFDALLGDLSAGRLSVSQPEERMAKSVSAAEAYAIINAGIDEMAAPMPPFVPKPLSPEQQRYVRRNKIEQTAYLLKAEIADGAFEKGKFTGQQALKWQMELHRMRDAMDRDEAAPIAQGEGRPGPLPAAVHPATFKAALSSALAAGKVSGTEAVRCEAGLMRGEAPDPDVMRRVMAA